MKDIDQICPIILIGFLLKLVKNGKIIILVLIAKNVRNKNKRVENL